MMEKKIHVDHDQSILRQASSKSIDHMLTTNDVSIDVDDDAQKDSVSVKDVDQEAHSVVQESMRHTFI